VTAIIRHRDKTSQTVSTPPVVATTSARAAEATALAASIGSEAVHQPPPSGYWLELAEPGLTLVSDTRPPMRLRVDFLAGAQGYRTARRGQQRELVARACGLAGHNARLPIIDATAGLGRDAFVLASLGAKVALFERDPVVHALLADGLARAREKLPEIIQRMTLSLGDARQTGAERRAGPLQAVYLDPMYPGRRRAAAGKELTMLQALLPGPDDEQALLDWALSLTPQRVVVKRQRRAPPLAGRAADHQLMGRSTRFDIYRPSKGAAG